MILLVLSLFGCNQAQPDPITEIGNPEMTLRARTTSSLPEWVATEGPTIQHIEQAWVSLSTATVLDAECASHAALSTAGAVMDWSSDAAVLVLPEPSDTSCGVVLELGVAETVPSGAPQALLGASVLLVGRDSLDRPFELRSTVQHTVTLARVLDEVRDVFSADAQLAVDLTVWTAGIDLASLPASEDGVVRLEDSGLLFDPNVPDAFRITEDYLEDGRVDPYDIIGSTAASAAPLADQDSDRLPDINERLIHATDPQDFDSDDDSLGDADEVLQYNTDPNHMDTDRDGVSDGYEVYNGTDPLDPESL